MILRWPGHAWVGIPESYIEAIFRSYRFSTPLSINSGRFLAGFISFSKNFSLNFVDLLVPVSDRFLDFWRLVLSTSQIVFRALKLRSFRSFSPDRSDRFPLFLKYGGDAESSNIVPTRFLNVLYVHSSLQIRARVHKNRQKSENTTIFKRHDNTKYSNFHN